MKGHVLMLENLDLEGITVTQARNASKEINLLYVIESRLKSLEFHMKALQKDILEINLRQYFDDHEKLTSLHSELFNLLSGSNHLVNKNSKKPLELENSYKKIRKTFYQSYPKTNEDHANTIFGIYFKRTAKGYTDDQKRLYELFMQMQVQKRRSDYIKRIKFELYEAQKKGWFVVFNTLTFQSARSIQEFYSDSRYFQEFNEAIKKDVCEAVYGTRKPPRGVKTHDYFRYIVVSEEGSENDRLHLHALQFFKKLPKGTIDPNRHRRVADYCQIDNLKKYWHHGFTHPIAIRTHGQDAWGREGWRWRVRKSKYDPEVYEPEPQTCVDQVAQYVGKYICKSINETKGKRQWKIKISRMFGLAKIQTFMKNLSQQELEEIIKAPAQTLKINKTSLSKSLIKYLASKEMIKMWIKKYGTPIYMKLLALSPKPSFIKKLMSSIGTKQKSKIWNVKDMLMLSIQNTDIYDVDMAVITAIQQKFKDYIKEIYDYTAYSTISNVVPS